MDTGQSGAVGRQSGASTFFAYLKEFSLADNS
jgi:hypothetical protein